MGEICLVCAHVKWGALADSMRDTISKRKRKEKKGWRGDGEMTQQTGALVAFPEHQGSVPSTHTVSSSHV